MIHDLGGGGAEKVLVNLVNNLDRKVFDISVTALFGGGVNEQYLSPDIHFHTVFSKMIPGNSKWMKLLSPMQLHRICVTGHYDIEVAYLEGPSARVISGCENKETKLVCWIHSKPSSIKGIAASFRNEKEARWCYSRFHKIVCVSKRIFFEFRRLARVRGNYDVLYNTIDSSQILTLSAEPAPDIAKGETVNLIAVGTLKEVKGYDRLIRIIRKLKNESYNIHLFILGTGPLEVQLKKQIRELGLEETISLLGYKNNPYCYIANCDLLISSSYSEGFSSVVAEALIVGTPVCATDVSGMREMLGDNKYGLIVSNSEEALYEGIKRLLEDQSLLEYYRGQASIRGKSFSIENTVKTVEGMLLNL